MEPPFAGCERSVSLREVLLGKPSESGSAETLRCLSVCCSLVVALSKLPMNLSEISVFLNFLCFLNGEQHLLTSLRFEYYLINTFVKEGSLPSIFKGCLALLSLRDISPHCGESSPSAELSQLDRSSPAAKDFYNVLLQNKNSPACFF